MEQTVGRHDRLFDILTRHYELVCRPIDLPAPDTIGIDLQRVEQAVTHNTVAVLIDVVRPTVLPCPFDYRP